MLQICVRNETNFLIPASCSTRSCVHVSYCTSALELCVTAHGHVAQWQPSRSCFRPPGPGMQWRTVPVHGAACCSSTSRSTAPKGCLLSPLTLELPSKFCMERMKTPNYSRGKKTTHTYLPLDYAVNRTLTHRSFSFSTSRTRDPQKPCLVTEDSTVRARQRKLLRLRQTFRDHH